MFPAFSSREHAAALFVGCEKHSPTAQLPLFDGDFSNRCYATAKEARAALRLVQINSAAARQGLTPSIAEHPICALVFARRGVHTPDVMVVIDEVKLSYPAMLVHKWFPDFLNRGQLFHHSRWGRG
jgi:hypothetical protein